jgi:SAM-dependent methyltransferase
MSGTPTIFDRRAVRRHRERAARMGGVDDLFAELAGRVLDRLDDTTRRFSRALDLGGRGMVAPALRARGIEVVSADLALGWARRGGGAALVADEECLPFAPGSFDLAVAAFGLHWVNDLPGALLQLRRALRPGGLFLAGLPVAGTLAGLRAALTEAEAEISGGVAPRFSPLPDLRDAAGLLQRAGFTLPVADVETLRLLYANPFVLLRELRAGGEGNALVARERRVPPRALFPAALARLPQQEGRCEATLEIAVLTGWAPDAESVGT